MTLDTYGYIIMEQSPLPGGYGDSCAETSRYATLLAVIGDKVVIDLSSFVTEKGVLRHPQSPWREDDTSGDQVAPLIAAADLMQPEVADKVINQLLASGNRTGNGDLIGPGLITNVRHQGRSMLWVSDLALLGQALLLKFPYRWSDSKKRFESTTGSSSDYLNFINGLAFARLKGFTWPCWLATKIISQDKALSKVSDYYKPEPNSDWILQLYIRAIPKIW